MKFDIWEKQQLEKAVNGTIKGVQANIKQIKETNDSNQVDRLKKAKNRLQKYLGLLEKIKRLR